MPDPFEVMTVQPYEVQQSPPSNDISNPFDYSTSTTAQRRRESFTSTSTARSRSLSSSTENNLERKLSPDYDSPAPPWKRKSSFVQRDQLLRQTSPAQLQFAASRVRPQSLAGPPSRRSNRQSLMMTATPHPPVGTIVPGMIYETPSSSSSSLPLHPPQPAFLGGGSASSSPRSSRYIQGQSSEDSWSLNSGLEGNPNDETPLQTVRRQSRLSEGRRGSETWLPGLPTEVIWPISMPDEDFMPPTNSKSAASIHSLSRRSSKISLSKKISRKSSGGALNSSLAMTQSPGAKTKIKGKAASSPSSPTAAYENNGHSRAASIAMSSAHSSSTSLHLSQSVRNSKPPSAYSRDFLSSLAPREGGYAIAAQIGSGSLGSDSRRKSYVEGIPGAVDRETRRAPVAKSGGMGRWSLDDGEQYGNRISPYTSRSGSSEHSINTSSNLSTQPPITPAAAGPVEDSAPIETLVTPVTPVDHSFDPERMPMLPAGASPPSTSSIATDAYLANSTPPNAPSPLSQESKPVVEPRPPEPLSKKEQKAKAKAESEQAARDKAEQARQAAKARAEQAQMEIRKKAQEKQAKEDAKKKAKDDKKKAKDDAKIAKRKASMVLLAPTPVAALPRPQASRVPTTDRTLPPKVLTASAPALQRPQPPPMAKKPSFFGSIRKRFASLGGASGPPPVPAISGKHNTPSLPSDTSASTPQVPVDTSSILQQPVAQLDLLPPVELFSAPPPLPPKPPSMRSTSSTAPLQASPSRQSQLSRSLSHQLDDTEPPATPSKGPRSDAISFITSTSPRSPADIPLPMSRSTTRMSPSPSTHLPSTPPLEARETFTEHPTPETSAKVTGSNEAEIVRVNDNSREAQSPSPAARSPRFSGASLRRVVSGPRARNQMPPSPTIKHIAPTPDELELPLANPLQSAGAESGTDTASPTSGPSMFSNSVPSPFSSAPSSHADSVSPSREPSDPGHSKDLQPIVTPGREDSTETIHGAPALPQLHASA